MGTLLQDLRYGARMLRRNPGFAAVAILTLAIGIGANVVIFSIVNGVLLKPLPFPDSRRVVTIWETDPNRNITRGTASAAEFLDWRDMNHVFQELSADRGLSFAISGNGDPEQVWGSQVSGNFFRMLRIAPLIGRDFTPEDEQPGHEQVVILGYGLWQRRYGGDAGIIGKSILLDQKPCTVIGVLPRGFSLYGTLPDFELWKPFAFNRAQLDRENHELVVFGRLKDGVPLSQANAEMVTIQHQLKEQYPAFDQQLGIRVVGFHDELVSSLRPGLLLLLAAVAVVLLIACANVANLMLARAAVREREIALRISLGAGRRRIFRQLLTESVLLSVIGAACGILFAYGGLRILHDAVLSGQGARIPHPEWIAIDGAVLGYTILVSCAAGILFGLAPAIQISRSALFESLKEGSRGSTSGRHSQLARSVLVVSEVAFSVMLLIGAGLLVRSFALMLAEPLGFDAANLLTVQVILPDAPYPNGPSILNFYQSVIERVNAIPGVTSASAANFLPLTRWTSFCDFEIAGRASPPSGSHFTAQYRVADWRYLSTMGVPVKEGRGFLSSDGPDAQGVALVNETLAQRYWPNQDPVGQQIRMIIPATVNFWEPIPREGWLTIVGIVGDIRDWAWADPKTGQLYLPEPQNPSRLMSLVVRSKDDRVQLTAAVRRAVASADPSQPVTEVKTMDDYLAVAFSQRRLNMSLLAFFAIVAALLAAIGIYGVMGYAVTQRSHEIGIRMALGAEPGDVLRMVVGDGMKLTGMGLTMGILGSLLAMKYLESQLYGVKARDPLTFIGVAAGLALVALAACYFPARRATKVDPLVALRYE
ncbi:MAG: ABC transporter permease [Candidatus Acidiferrales bacterium]